MSAFTLIATANARRIYIPEEYVRTGLVIYSPNSAKSTISFKRASISFFDSPNIDALMYMFSIPVISGWNPAPNSNKLDTLPLIFTSPKSGYIILVRIFNVVLFPQPFCPISPIDSPFFTLKLIPFNTHFNSYLFLFQDVIRSFIVLPLSAYTLNFFLTFLTSIIYLLSITLPLSRILFF